MKPAREKRTEVKMKKLVAAFVGLSTLDIILTLIFVGSGSSIELNPYMAKILTLPLPVILLYKVGLPVLLGLALIALDKSPAARIVHPRGALKLVVVILAGVCLFNLGGLIT